MRVLIVDDSAFMRRAISQMLATDPKIEIVGTARNGREGVEMAQQLKPDVITMDIEMPEMDGLTALKQIMRQSPTNVLMLSSLTTEGSHAALTALRYGAADVLAKDVSQVSLSITNIQEDLLHRVRALAVSKRRLGNSPVQVAAPADHPPKLRPGQFDLILIASSTGGPPVLESILELVPSSLTTPIVIAQHMPELFTRSMAERLDTQCALAVRHADNGMAVEPSMVYIAPGGKHLSLRGHAPSRLTMHTSEEPATEHFRPSANVLFASAAKCVGQRTLAVVLTGIGEDGLEGAKELKQANATLLAQDEASCVVYGMPKAVTQNGLVAASLAPDEIGQCLSTLATGAAQTTVSSRLAG